MSKSTPGPWYATKDVVDRWHVDADYAGAGKDYTPVADVLQGEADANLLAHAPAMRDMLEIVTAKMETLLVRSDVIDAARALLREIHGP